MWGIRWTARFLLLVMLAPAYEPLAMACAVQPGATHCLRQSLSGSLSGSTPGSMSASVPARGSHPEMPCHHATAQSTQPQPESSQGESSETSFQAASDDNCCKTHCCCGAITSEWAQPASGLRSFLGLPIGPAQPSQGVTPHSIDISGHDSARAPPRS